MNIKAIFALLWGMLIGFSASDMSWVDIAMRISAIMAGWIICEVLWVQARGLK